MKSYLLLLLTFFYFGAIAQNETSKALRTYAANGIKVSAYDYSGFEKFLTKSNDTTYVVNFWATWCTPCIKELPYFEKLNTAYKNQKVKVILVSMDLPKQAESRLLPFIKSKGLQSDVLLLDDPDANAWIEKVAASWSGAIPATVIYNATMRKFYERSFTYDELINELNPFIK